MAFTTTQGSGANDATTFVGTSGVDSINLINVATPVFLGAQEDNDVIVFTSNLYTNVVSGYTLRGGDGNDSITTSTEVFNAGFINGNAGIDTITLSAVESSTVFGGQGADIIATGALGNTRVNGNAGNDRITVVSATSSSIFSGQGQDTIVVSGAVIGSVIQGDNDVDGITLGVGSYTSSTINGNAGDDTITVGAITGFTGSTVFGGAGDDTITAATAGVGVAISGDDGADILVGSAFADTIIGGAGNDTITGGVLADTMTGGAGVNTYVYGTGTGDTGAATGDVATGVVDVITDFENTGSATTWDLIDLQAAGTANTFDTATAGTATYAAALTAANTALDGTHLFTVQAVGSATSWTAYLFTDSGATGSATGAIQLGTTGQFGTAALALASISAAQITA